MAPVPTNINDPYFGDAFTGPLTEYLLWELYSHCQ